jgi:hypothetical protein
MTLKLLLFFCIANLTAIKCIAQSDNSRENLNDLVNVQIDSVIKSLPPKISFSFFHNGKFVKKHLSVKAHLLNTPELIYGSDSLIINQKYFNSVDSIFFSTEFYGNKLVTSNIHIKHFLHGGSIVFNLVTNYSRQLNKYLKDSIRYVNSNSSSYLYYLMRNRQEKYKSDQNGEIYFIIIKSNTYPFIFYLDGKL